ncbi:hypothetical protein Tsubulata_015828 [Turnera subulata]|uniref:S-acyltransferase n=1 Tax=Turnera subulata TaxID=218843 RepID=A0A9Q0IXV7_9ROSI|nr:hypothetical protein Tsubulata_015828 [Turnera subulata]
MSVELETKLKPNMSVLNERPQDFVTTIIEDNETVCWGCGVRLVLPSHSPVFKCGWCGAITNRNHSKCDHKKGYWWRRIRDRCFVAVLLCFMLFVIGGGVWAVHPVVFSISYFCGIFHSTVTFILSITTLSLFSLAAFRRAGPPPVLEWGSYPAVVGKGQLENYTFCHYCSKPKSPRTHHCRSCGLCVLDMDHHCPFIGNCVGAGNHRHFIAFLVSAVISIAYVAIMSSYTGLRVWPEIPSQSLGRIRGSSTYFAGRIMKETVSALLSSALLLSTRGLVLVYLFVASVSLEIGLCVLLWQQLYYIYAGKTYLSHLSSEGVDDDGEKDWKNIFRFFGFSYSVSRYLPTVRNSAKKHKK